MARDYSDGEMKTYKFALRLGTTDACKDFKKAFDDAVVFNHCIRMGIVATPATVVEEVKSE